MIFKQAIVKSVKADLAAGSITLSFTVGLEEQKVAEELAFFVGKDAGDLTLDIHPHTTPMKAMVEMTVKKLD